MMYSIGGQYWNFISFCFIKYSLYSRKLLFRKESLNLNLSACLWSCLVNFYQPLQKIIRIFLQYFEDFFMLNLNCYCLSDALYLFHFPKFYLLNYSKILIAVWFSDFLNIFKPNLGILGLSIRCKRIPCWYFFSNTIVIEF